MVCVTQEKSACNAQQHNPSKYKLNFGPTLQPTLSYTGLSRNKPE